MLALGMLLGIGGLIAVIYAMAQQNTGEYILGAALGAEEAATIDSVLYFGIALLVVGIIMTLVYFAGKGKEK